MVTRVAVLVDSLGVGGTERNAVRVVSALSPAHFEVAVLALQDGPLHADAMASSLTLVLPRSKRTRLWDVGSFLRRWRPHVVHTQDRYTNPLGVWVRAVVPRAELIISRRWSEGYGTTRSRWGNRAAAALARGIVVNSAWAANQAMEDSWSSSARTVVIPNMVDASLLDAEVGPEARHRARDRLGVCHSDFLIVAVANLRPVKGHDLLLSGFAGLCRSGVPARLALVGAGELREDLARLSRDLGVAERVTFVGSAGPAEWQVASDVCVLSSRSEASPNVLAEAAALARPVVATAVGGVPEIVQDGTTGLLVPRGEPRALTRALATLWQEPEVRAGMGNAARVFARQKFSPAAVLPMWEALYRGEAGPGQVGQ